MCCAGGVINWGIPAATLPQQGSKPAKKPSQNLAVQGSAPTPAQAPASPALSATSATQASQPAHTPDISAAQPSAHARETVSAESEPVNLARQSGKPPDQPAAHAVAASDLASAGMLAEVAAAQAAADSLAEADGWEHTGSEGAGDAELADDLPAAAQPLDSDNGAPAAQHAAALALIASATSPQLVTQEQVPGMPMKACAAS